MLSQVVKPKRHQSAREISHETAITCSSVRSIISGVGTYLSGTARAVPLLKVRRLVMHFAVPLFGHRLHIALMIDV